MPYRIVSARYLDIEMTYIKTCRLTIVIASIIMVLLLLSIRAHAQTTAPTQVIKKFNGEQVTFIWEHDITDEALATHFSLRWVDDLTKTTIELRTVPISLRTTSISAACPPHFKFTYYNLYAVKVDPTTVSVDSLPTNTVATERIGRPPRNLSAQ